MYMSHDRSCVSHDRPTDRVAVATWRAGASTLKSPRRVSRSGHVSNSNKHQVSTVHKSRGGGGATDRPTSHAAATEAPPTPTPTLDGRSTGRRSRVYSFLSRPARVSRSRARRRERRARTPVGRTDRILARGGGGRGRSRGRIVDAGDDATRAWGRKRAWEVKRKRPRAVAETRGRKTRGRRRRRRGRGRATDRRRGRRSNSCDES